MYVQYSMTAVQLWSQSLIGCWICIYVCIGWGSSKSKVRRCKLNREKGDRGHKLFCSLKAFIHLSPCILIVCRLESVWEKLKHLVRWKLAECVRYKPITMKTTNLSLCALFCWERKMKFLTNRAKILKNKTAILNVGLIQLITGRYICWENEKNNISNIISPPLSRINKNLLK